MKDSEWLWRDVKQGKINSKIELAFVRRKKNVVFSPEELRL